MGEADPKHPRGKRYTENELTQHRDKQHWGNWFKHIKGSLARYCAPRCNTWFLVHTGLRALCGTKRRRQLLRVVPEVRPLLWIPYGRSRCKQAFLQRPPFSYSKRLIISDNGFMGFSLKLAPPNRTNPFSTARAIIEPRFANRLLIGVLKTRKYCSGSRKTAKHEVRVKPLCRRDQTGFYGIGYYPKKFMFVCS